MSAPAAIFRFGGRLSGRCMGSPSVQAHTARLCRLCVCDAAQVGSAWVGTDAKENLPTNRWPLLPAMAAWRERRKRLHVFGNICAHLARIFESSSLLERATIGKVARRAHGLQASMTMRALRGSSLL